MCVLLHTPKLSICLCFRFVVYLQLGPESIDDICFMFDVRFDFCNKTNVTVRNNRLSGTWDIDEIHASSFPFRPNEPFDIAIMIDHNHYKVGDMGLSGGVGWGGAAGGGYIF